jgi:ATP-dependent helicase/nuclease subunit A
MRTDPVLPESEKRVRIEATSPELDAWVSANAGSGKTTILRNRVIRLLLEGTAPDRILCLTYTKAAAAEMQGRIFSELARWVTLDDAALAEAIARLEGRLEAPPARELVLARTLFARAIEAPGGLKIQTIHAFAERVLHLFPLEAGVPLNFDVLETADARDLRHAARQQAITLATENPASKLGLAFGEILAACNTEAFAKALDTAVDELAGLRMRDESLPAMVGREAVYRAALGIAPGETLPKIEADFTHAALAIPEMEATAETIREDRETGKKDGELARSLLDVAAMRRAGKPWIETYLRLFLTAALSPRTDAFTKGIKKRHPGLEAIEATAKAACDAFVERRRAFLTFTRSLALLAFAEFVLDHFEEAKAARNALDFNDLIAALRRLLTVADASWIMMKLDASIEHVLIDEAQDTTREMWDIIRRLTSEFFAGEGRARKFRSIFVVGDEKQSIFSFQGADPAVFEESRAYFAGKSLRPENIRRPVELKSSFRSSGDILKAVDQVFATPARAEGLTASGQQAAHIAARQPFPGLVEVWPLERPRTSGDEDAATVTPASVLLADRIADQIAEWLQGDVRHFVDGEPIRAGDILILVQQRSQFFTAMLKALKLRQIPVSGADRLRLQEELVIRDLLVIAEAALLEADDLALATALKTPIFGLDDQDIERLARGRTGSLAEALAKADSAGLHAIAKRWRELVDAVRWQSPFVFFSGLLASPAPVDITMSGRKAFLARLGEDASDPLDAFLLEAQAFTRVEPASVLLFVQAQRGRETELKRDLEHGGDKVRVMTVHGSKGLEARVVFLGDTIQKPDRGKEKPAFVLAGPDKLARAESSRLLVWSGRKPDEAEPLRAARASERRRQFAEYRRLLYVGMTRAADRLYVAGFAGPLPKSGKPGKSAETLPGEETWYGLVEAGLSECAAAVDVTTGDAPDGMRTLRRLASGVAPALPAAGAPKIEMPPPDLPDWLNRPVAHQPAPLPPLRPSKSRAVFAPTKAPDESEGIDRRRRGILLHQLFEWLPRIEPEQRFHMGQALIARLAPGLTREEAGVLLEPVIRHLASPSGLRLFGPDSRAEVALAGTITLGDGTARSVAGRIDRLVVGEDRIDIVDVKSGAVGKAVENATICRQMALYRALLAAIYPGKPIECTIFWIETGEAESLPPAILDHSFRMIAQE